MSTTMVDPATDRHRHAGSASYVRWGLLATGFAWIVASVLILAFDERSVRVVGVTIGFVLILAAASQIIEVIVAPSQRWVHASVAVVMVVAGAAAFAAPFQTVGALSLLVGLALAVRGTVGVALCLSRRDAAIWWGLRLAVAIGELCIGLWAIGYPGRSLTLLLLWVGAAAMFRGVGQIVLAFSSPGEG